MDPSTRKLLLAWRWPLTFLTLGGMAMFLVLAVVVFAGSMLNRNMQSGIKASEGAMKTLERLVSGATSVSIKESFLAGIPEISDAGGGRLELAKVDRVESLKSEDRLSVFWNHISLGTSTAEIRVPVTYRYYVNLDDVWDIQTNGPVCHVQAPRLRTMLPPAIHSHRMEKRSQNGWARFGSDDQLDTLEKDLLPTLVQYAEDEAVMVLVRDQARKSLTRFVRHWLLQQFPDLNEEVKVVQVRFSAEPSSTFETGLQPLMTLHE
ncbi:MAG: DUF4230 domain-containing protein [Verrucomicrobia bacterium]|jgi:hypothetical protein|nr:DUF4230 domain-containing protein [Verrucomicrobiota bacterium]